MDSGALFQLMTWLSPSYPVGAYSYSHGLEWAVETGDITSRTDLEAWISTILRHGSGRNDAILFAQAHEAARRSDWQSLAHVAELAVAFAGSQERWLETTSQGAAFIEVTSTVWPSKALVMLKNVVPGPVAYPVAVAVVSLGHTISAETALVAYLHAFAANLVSAAVRLVPLGQTDGQRAIATLEPVVHETAALALASDLADLGGSALGADLAAMHHETQTTRLFRS